MPIDREAIAEIDEDVLLADGWDEAFIGLTDNHLRPISAVYSIDKIVQIMVERDGMSYDDAEEYAAFNITGAYVGKHTPVYVRATGLVAAAEPETPAGDRAVEGLPYQGGLAAPLTSEYREAIPQDRFDIVEVLEKYCHEFDANQMRAICDRAARVIKQLRQCVLAYKERKSLAKQVEALERRLESADAALFRAMEK
jgi:hypothetical protein